jgi:hypothetical protein
LLKKWLVGEMTIDPKLDTALEHWRSLIEAEYRRLGHTLGWRLLTCPKENITAAAVALITINPGGENFLPAMLSVEAGSAYVVETWPARQQPLQWQVRRMYQMMNVRPDKVLSGYLVPFRSPSWNDLPKRAEGTRFGISLWRAIFGLAHFETIIAFGKDTAPYMVNLLSAALATSIRADWADQTIDVYRFGASRRLIVLPHLSRYRLFNRPGSEAAFRTALAV